MMHHTRTLTLDGDDWEFFAGEPFATREPLSGGEPSESAEPPLPSMGDIASSGPAAGAKGLPASVPGDVHLDLLRAGRIGEPLAAKHAQEQRWIEDRPWWYRRRFALDELPVDADRVELVCEGLDTTAVVYLNGKEIGRGNNAFVPYVFDVADALKSGENELVIRLECGPRSVSDRDFARYGGMGDKVWGWRSVLRKPQFTDGWDWAPHLLTCGIWKPIRIEFRTSLAIRSVTAESRVAMEYRPVRSDRYAETEAVAASAVVTTCIEVESFSEAPLAVDVEISLRPESPDARDRAAADQPAAKPGASAATSRRVVLQPGPSKLSFDLSVDNPNLWWPNGQGPQHFYRLELTLSDGRARLTSVSRRIGIRSVRIERDALGEEGESFVFVVNGKKVFAKGANWVPADGIPVRVDAEKYRRLLTDARDAHFTMLRVWGGGIYESEGFYNLCDELGIMVWQDFMFACAFYADDDPAYLADVEHEAEAALLRLNHHPSIVLWCGNNENDQIYHHMTQTDWEFYKQFHPVERFFGERIYHELLPRVCARVLPNALYWPSSPFGEPSGNPNSRDCGDRHSWDNGYRDFRSDTAKFASEYGVMSFPVAASVRAYCLSGSALPEPDNEVLAFHANDMDPGNKRIVGGLVQYIDADAESYDLHRLILASQYFQGRTLQESFEHYRRRRFLTAGALFWMYSDSWGTAGWTVVDYYCRRKASYYHTRRGFAPTNVSLRRDSPVAVSVWGVDDGAATANPDAACIVEAISFDGRSCRTLLHTTARVRQNGVRLIGQVELDEALLSESRRVYLRARLTLSDGTTVTGLHFLHEDIELELPPPDLRLAVLPADERSGSIELSSSVFCRMVWIDEEPFEWIEDNAVALHPGEARSVAYRLRPDHRAEEIAVHVL